ncbi:hypothetical protein Peur_066763 [Populus x canadensis]
MDLFKVKDQVKGMDFKEIIQTQTAITGKINMSQATSQSNQQGPGNLSKNANGVRQICDKHGNTYLNYFNRFNHSFQANDIPQALESLTIADNQIFEWFQDTVTLPHMIRNDGKYNKTKSDPN